MVSRFLLLVVSSTDTGFKNRGSDCVSPQKAREQALKPRFDALNFLNLLTKYQCTNLTVGTGSIKLRDQLDRTYQGARVKSHASNFQVSATENTWTAQGLTQDESIQNGFDEHSNNFMHTLPELAVADEAVAPSVELSKLDRVA